MSRKETQMKRDKLDGLVEDIIRTATADPQLNEKAA